MSFENNYLNACKLIRTSRSVAETYENVHFWEDPKPGTFNFKLCRQLGIAPTPANIAKILAIVNDWNIHQVLKKLFQGKSMDINPQRKEINADDTNSNDSCFEVYVP